MATPKRLNEATENKARKLMMTKSSDDLGKDETFDDQEESNDDPIFDAPEKIWKIDDEQKAPSPRKRFWKLRRRSESTSPIRSANATSAGAAAATPIATTTMPDAEELSNGPGIVLVGRLDAMSAGTTAAMPTATATTPDTEKLSDGPGFNFVGQPGAALAGSTAATPTATATTPEAEGLSDGPGNVFVG